MLLPYDALWRYFAWCNQMLSVFTLWTITVWLAKNGKIYWISMIPAIFMTMVTMTYIVFAPEGFGAIVCDSIGMEYGYYVSLGFGVAVSALFTGLFYKWKGSLSAIHAI